MPHLPSTHRLVGVALACLLSGCAAAPPDDSGPMAIRVGALSGTCGGAAANPFAEIQRFEVVVRAPDDNGVLTERARSESALSVGQSNLTVGRVPAGEAREVTLLGYGPGASEPSWFARSKGLRVQKNETTALEVSLMRFDGHSCLEANAPMPNVVFPAVTPMAEGKVLITGGFGFASASALSNPVRDAWIFDTRTGKVTKTSGQMSVGRGGHSAIYLARENQVLLVGGAKEMNVGGGGPPTWTVSQGVNPPYEIYDVETDSFSAPAAVATDPAQKRVFPNLLKLSDDYVVSAGGAVWPVNEQQASTSYLYSDRFDPATETMQNSITLPMSTARGGAAVAELGRTSDGLSKFIFWGGTTTGSVAEVFTESTQIGEGLFDGDYAVKGDVLGGGGLYFPTLTRITDVVDGGATRARFLSAGGVRYDGGASAWQAPRADDVYLVTVDEDDKIINTSRAGSLAVGTFLHGATAVADGAVVLTGGMSGFDNTTAGLQVFEQLAAGDAPAIVTPASSAGFVVRGGHGSLRLENDCVLLFGGIEAWPDLTGSGEAVADVYCPSVLRP